MPETIIHVESSEERFDDEDPRANRFPGRAGAFVRRAAAVTLLVIGFVVTLAATGVLVLAALAIAVIALAGIAVMWLLGRVLGGRRAAADTRTLEARKGPHGWTVETRRYSF
jgi:tetrahydromethanopterin S-methyltransferase subunit B